MVKYVNETGKQIKQNHVDPYIPQGSQTNIGCLSVYSAIIFVICHLSVLGKNDFDKRNECMNTNGYITGLIAHNGLT
jgi:hypothetical protein